MKYNVELHAFRDGEIRTVDVPLDREMSVNSDFEMLELIFLYGQNEVQPQRLPSVSIGDVIYLKHDRKFKVDFFGFEEIAA